jgi:ZIP family zinc transporter
LFIEWFKSMSPVSQAFLATLFTWFVTALGASLVFFMKSVKQKVLNFMLGFASGVMIAASFWSLLLPAIAMVENIGVPDWIPAAIGFLLGGIFLRVIDEFLPHLHPGLEVDEAEGVPTSIQRSTLLVLAVTLHNIPEGLAVGVAFGALAADLSSASLTGAIALAVGIGIQNFPEGTAVSIPLRQEGLSRWKSFLYGQASGVVEPIAGIAGAAAVIIMRPVLPYALAFAAGAMIFVVGEELIPESHHGDGGHMGIAGLMLGFTVMMILDVALG